VHLLAYKLLTSIDVLDYGLSHIRFTSRDSKSWYWKSL